MRKKRSILRHVPDTAALGRKVDAALAVEQSRVVDDDPSLCPAEAGDRFDQRCLTRAGAADERRDVRRQRAANLKPEWRERQPDVDLDHAANRLRCCAMSTLLIATSTQAIPTTHATRTSASR